MSYALAIEKEGDVLRVTATGQRSLKTVLAMSSDIFAACAEKKIMKVLLDVRALEGRLPTMDTFDLVDRHFPKIRDRRVITHSAIVDLKEFESGYKFLEDLAVNRGFNLRIFSDPEDAIAWLDRDPAQQDARPDAA